MLANAQAAAAELLTRLGGGLSDLLMDLSSASPEQNAACRTCSWGIMRTELMRHQQV
jgi:hypothetical protein